jgi:hypothetical protein
VAKDKKISAYKGSTFALAVKFLVIGFALWYIYKQVFLKENLHDILDFYGKVFDDPRSWLWLSLTVLLMSLNWSLEAVKWRYMIRKLEKIPFITAVKAVLSGVTVSFFTPNRVGEFGGRIFHLQKADKIKAALITVLSSMSQLIITLLLGSFCFVLYLAEHFSEQPYLFQLIVFSLLLLMTLTLALFLYPSVLFSFFNKLIVSEKIRGYITVFNYYTARQQGNVLLLSLLRYLVFSFQFYLMLVVFQVDISLLQAFRAISLTFLVVAVVPTVALTEIGVRGSAAVYFIGMYSSGSFGILTASFTLWLINIILPALIGSVFVLQIKLNR